MALPDGSNVVRLCSKALLGDEGEVTSSCFVPHPGTDERPADRYLSVHWLEYLGRGSVHDCIAALREFLLASTIPGERRPTRQGKLAVLNCADVEAATAGLDVAIEFAHQPRPLGSATSVEVDVDGQILRWGHAREQAAATGAPLDPHRGLFTLPEEAAHALAVQQLLAQQVIHMAPGLVT